MNDHDRVRVATVVQQALLTLRRARYDKCVAQLNLFTGRLEEVLRRSKRLGLAVARNWLIAADHCRTSVRRQLDETLCSAAQVQRLLERPRKEVPKLSGLIEELRAVESEFGAVEFNVEERALCVATEPITLAEVYLGPFRIALFLERLGQLYHQIPYYVTALEPNPAASDESITHPHVSNEVVCEGDGAAAIRAALEDGRLCDFFIMVRTILQTYNPESPYVPLAEWYGVPCYDCGYVMDSESSCYCSYCDHAVCDQCSSVCTACAEIVCGECVVTCAVCESSVCPSCANKSKCTECKSACCPSCLNDGLCSDCQEERNHKDEDDKTEDAKMQETPNASREGATAVGPGLVGRRD